MQIGIDLGGTKTEIIVLEPQAHNQESREIFRQRVPTPSHSYDEIVDTIVNLIKTAEQKTAPAESIGIGIPGVISAETGLVKNANSTVLIGHALDLDLEKKLNKKVEIANDANCFTLSEATDGAARDFDMVFGVIIGTGTGGGISLHKKILAGSNLIGGEWGHNQMPYLNQSDHPGRPCYCGKTDCIETYLSGPGFSKTIKQVTGKELSAGQATELLPGNRQLEKVFKLYEDQLARALSGVMNILDMHCIVLGGGLSNIDRLYENVPKIWGRYVFSDTVNTCLVRARFGDSSGVRGAARLRQRKGLTVKR